MTVDCGTSEEGCDLFLSIAIDIVERGDRALVLAERSKGLTNLLPQLVTLRPGLGFILAFGGDLTGSCREARLAFRRIQRYEGGALAPRQPVAVLEHDALQPRREGLGDLQPLQTAARLHKGPLRGVLRRLDIPQDGVGIAKGHVLEPPYQRAIGVRVARPD